MESVRGDEGTAPPTDVSGAVRTSRIEVASIRSVLRIVDPPRLSWADRNTAVAAGGSAASIAAGGADRFETVKARAQSLFDGLRVPEELPHEARPRLFGGFAFHEGHTNPGPDATWHGYPGAYFVLPAVQVTQTDDGTWLTVTATGQDASDRAESRLETWTSRVESAPDPDPAGPPGISVTEPTPSREGWREQVQAATRQIARGDLEKVVLAQSRQVSLQDAVSVPDALARLERTYPDCYRFMFEPTTGGTFYGATPERLVTLNGRTVKTEALAGSTGRGETTAEDEWLASELRESEKDRHEHDLVVDAIREQLTPLAAEVRTGSLTIRRLATVQHLQTPIRADLADDEHVLTLVEGLHPTPAVGGLPPDAALDTIMETEAFSRGWYAAPVGWIDASGDGTFAVAIRSALASGQSATLFAGAGIVADSDPDEEWDELQLKYGPMLDELE